MTIMHDCGHLWQYSDSCALRAGRYPPEVSSASLKSSIRTFYPQCHVSIPGTLVYEHLLKRSNEIKSMVLLAKNNEDCKCKILLTNVIFLQVHAEEISGNNGYVELSFCAKKLDDKVRGAHIFETWFIYY